MGKQNDAFTAYLGRAEVLADLYNGCLYQGEKVVQAGNLCEVQQFYQQGLSERVKRPTSSKAGADDSGICGTEKLCFTGSRSAESAAFDDAVSLHGI